MGTETDSRIASVGPLRPAASDTHTKVLVWVVVLVLISASLWLASDILLVVFAAVLLAIFLRALSDWLSEKTRLSERWSLVLVVVLLILIVGGLLWLIVPRVTEQIDQLTVTLPAAVQQWKQYLERYGWGRWLVAHLLTTNELLFGKGDWLASLSSFFSTTFGAVLDLALTGIIGLYIAAEADRYKAGLVSLFPREKQARVRDVLEVTAHTLRWWLLGQMVAMAFLGVFAFIGLSLLKIPLALTLAIFTAILTFIPNLGAFISVIPPILLALAESPLKAFNVLLFYVILQNIEGYFVTPMVQRRAISLPPALLISAQVFLAMMLGIFGLVLAAPLTAVALVLVKMVYLEDTLGDRTGLLGYSGKS